MQFIVLFSVGLLLIDMGVNANAGSIIAVFVATDQLIEVS
jgi:hypothetical protein